MSPVIRCRQEKTRSTSSGGKIDGSWVCSGWLLSDGKGSGIALPLGQNAAEGSVMNEPCPS